VTYFEDGVEHGCMGDIFRLKGSWLSDSFISSFGEERNNTAKMRQPLLSA